MKSIKMALLGGAALAVTAAGAQADDLDALKAQIEALNARVAAMEAAPSVPAGYQLLAISEVDYVSPPGVEMSAREQRAFGSKATQIAVMPTADAPAGATITWSGYVRGGVVYTESDVDGNAQRFNSSSDRWENITGSSEDFDGLDSDDLDVPGYGRVRVDASTDTAVGEIGVAIRMEADFDGGGDDSVDMDVAWGWWQMTPELAFGGGYSGSLSNMDLGADGFNGYLAGLGDVFFSLGDRSQLRLTYGSGPITAAVSLDDATNECRNEDSSCFDGAELGVSGRLGYAGDMFNVLLTGGWGAIDENDYDTPLSQAAGADDNWLIAAGVGFAVTEMANFSIGAGMGEGNYETYDPSTGNTSTFALWDNSWWGVNALAAFSFTDEIDMEIGAGYKSRDLADVDAPAGDLSGDVTIWSVAGGLYYDPVDQLTIGLEAAWTSTEAELQFDQNDDGIDDGGDIRVGVDETDTTFAFVGIWRF
jgi:hypothetical protein